MTDVPSGLAILPITGLGDVRPGDDLADLIARAAPWLADGDVLVVTSKIVSKAEGALAPVPPEEGPDRDEARAGVLAAETARVVARRGPTSIVATRHGFVMAAAGIDASNVDPDHLVLLPKDPDASARALRSELRDRYGLDVVVIISDTMGRPWRNGLTDVALGVAGLEAIRDYRGERDAYGNELQITQMSPVDELAGAAELVKGKYDQVPVAVVRGLGMTGSARRRGSVDPRPLGRHRHVFPGYGRSQGRRACGSQRGWTTRMCSRTRGRSPRSQPSPGRRHRRPPIIARAVAAAVEACPEIEFAPADPGPAGLSEASGPDGAVEVARLTVTLPAGLDGRHWSASRSRHPHPARLAGLGRLSHDLASTRGRRDSGRRTGHDRPRHHHRPAAPELREPPRCRRCASPTDDDGVAQLPRRDLGDIDVSAADLRWTTPRSAGPSVRGRRRR